jgi:hypothetical protein
MVDISLLTSGSASEVKRGKAMAYVDVLRYLKFKDLTDKQRNALKKRFQQRKRDLEAAIRTVEQGLKALAEPPTAKKAAKRGAAKRKAARGPTKR